MTSGELERGGAGRQTEASQGFPEEATWREQAVLGSGRTFWQRKEQVQRLQRQPEPGRPRLSTDGAGAGQEGALCRGGPHPSFTRLLPQVCPSSLIL